MILHNLKSDDEMHTEPIPLLYPLRLPSPIPAAPSFRVRQASSTGYEQTPSGPRELAAPSGWRGLTQPLPALAGYLGLSGRLTGGSAHFSQDHYPPPAPILHSIVLQLYGLAEDLVIILQTQNAAKHNAH